jgi:four helix bundle protein
VDTELRVLDAARMIVDDVNALLHAPRSRCIHADQLRKSAESIAANIREGYGHESGADRNRFLRYARASAEETDEHLRSNFAANRVAAAPYWRIHNRIAVVVRMLKRLGVPAADSLRQ